MKYALIISIISYLCGSFYMIFGAVTIKNNAKSNINRLFLILASSLAIWSFAYSISTTAPTAEVSAFWRSFSVLGWGAYSSLLLHFILILVRKKSRLNRSIFIALYLPVLVNIILFGPFGCLVEKQYKMVQTDFGWMNMAPMHAGGIWLNSYYIVFSIVSLILLIYWWKKIESHTSMKRYATCFLITILLLFSIEFAIDALPDILGKSFSPRLPTLFILIPTIMLYAVLKKFRFIVKKRRQPYLSSELSENNKTLDEDRLRFFQTTTAIFLFGGAMSFLVGYFVLNGTLERELSLAAALLAIGIFARFIPVITKNHAVQNTLFLLISISTLLHFMATNIETGALTIWSVYILLLLFTVILDSKICAYIFFATSIAIQGIFWIFHPKIYVVIDGNEYMARMFIIALSFFAVRYLTNEYASKEKEYRRFAKEQEILETISSSFISINTENARKKIDEMLEISAEVLDFDHAYLIEFDTNYERAIFLNTYVKDVTKGSLPYRPGMKVETVALPIVGTLIAQKKPVLCDDITNIDTNENEEVKNFFFSRGIHSFFAVPFSVNEKIIGMLVAEYFERSERTYRESRLYFLKILANILGDARQKVVYEKKLYEFAYFDETTKLANRNMLRKNLGQILYNRKETEKVAILDIELENLKTIKDTFGHHVGEQIVIESAIILRNSLEKCCHISRSAEGAFVVVLPTVKNTEQIEKCANKIIDSFSHPISVETKIEALFVIISIGISVYPDHGRDVETLLKNAVLAGYAVKHTGKKMAFYTEQLKNQIAEDTLFTNRLFNSLQNEEFSLEFQPQVRCDTGKAVGIEALLRWTTDDNKRIPPDRFIPMLEQTGLIYDVGLWVLKQALQEHNRLIEKGFPPLRVSVNLSIVQFERKEFILDFSKIIKGSKVKPKYIELEITESSFSENPEEVINKLHQLKDLGINIALDDFGIGYSSFNRLKSIPFDKIKIDKGIIDNIDLQRKKAPITESILTLAKAFSASVTVEGVETKEQADFLRSLDCDEMQGYYFSRPLSPAALEDFLKKQ